MLERKKDVPTDALKYLFILNLINLLFKTTML
jgi:hypothetical protein